MGFGRIKQPRTVCTLNLLNILKLSISHNRSLFFSYKQTFLDEDKNGDLVECQDSHVFLVCVVPMRILCEEQGSQTKTIVWNNDYPSSVTLCRPKRLIYAKETRSLTQLTTEEMEQEISALCPTAIQIEGIEIKVHTTMILSMVDTKVVNDITETVSQACFICSKSGRRLNDAVESTAEDLGICSQVFSPLHAKIRSMEQFLNIAYKMTLDEPKWRVSKNNGTVTDRQDTIRQSLRDELGLRISAAVPGGGNSNDGNTADVFFANVAIVSRITGLDEELLERISALLTVLNSRERIDAAAYRLYAEETRKLYIKLYDWYPLSPTLHKILVHGADIIKRSLLPIGMLSEEAQEARNKSIRKFRQFHARKFNRTVNLEDVFKRLMFTSDPVVSLSNRRVRARVVLNLPANAKHLIIDWYVELIYQLPIN